MLYALYVPTARRTVHHLEMERFPSREEAGRILKRRNNTRQSRTYWIGDHQRSATKVAGSFHGAADKTGYMRVFLRYAADPVPALLDTPDEEWIVERGGRDGGGVVVRLPWSPGDERLTLGTDPCSGQPCLTIEPVPALGWRADDTPEYEIRKPITTAPAQAPCPSCFQIPSATGRCGCS